MTQFFISDTHFGHENILNFKKGKCNCGATPPEGGWGKGQHAIHTLQCDYTTSEYVRPFNSVEEMDELMVLRWNTIVRPGDHVWHLGDVTMNPSKNLKIIKRLAGIKGLILGNHDSGTAQQYLAAGFKKIAAYRVYNHMLFSHLPIAIESRARFDHNIHGHTHGNNLLNPFYVNVSVEQIDYTPVSLEQLDALGRKQHAL